MKETRKKLVRSQKIRLIYKSLQNNHKTTKPNWIRDFFTVFFRKRLFFFRLSEKFGIVLLLFLLLSLFIYSSIFRLEFSVSSKSQHSFHLKQRQDMTTTINAVKIENVCECVYVMKHRHEIWENIRMVFLFISYSLTNLIFSHFTCKQ